MAVTDQWAWCLVDDWIPVDANTTPRFIRSRSGNKIWMMILEKSYAKLHGCYQFMRGGHNSPTRGRTAFGMPQVLHMLTEGNAMKTVLESGDQWDHNGYYTSGSKLQTAELFHEMTKYSLEGWIENCGTNPDCDRGGIGLVPSHAYSIIRAEQVGTNSSVKVRNTWGSSEWRLEWGDSDTVNWTPELKAELGFTGAEDVIFWMRADDFRQRFQQVTFCQFVDRNLPPPVPHLDIDTAVQPETRQAPQPSVCVLQGAERKFRT